jgi:hypothetical protein
MDVRSLSDAELIRRYGGDQLGAPPQPITEGGLGAPKVNFHDMSDEQLLNWYEQHGDPMDPVTDVARSAPKAVYRGVTGIGGTPGLLDSVMSGGVNAVAGVVGGEQHPRLFGPGGGVSNLFPEPIAKAGVLPTPGELEKRISERNPALANLPEAKTPLGKVSSAAITGGIGSLAFGGGGPVRSALVGGMAGGAGEAAGQGAEAMGVDPGAADALRLGVTLAAGGAGNMMRPHDVSPPRAAIAHAAEEHFTNARAAGVVVDQPAVANVVDDMINIATREGHMDRPAVAHQLHPTPLTQTVLDDFSRASMSDLTLDQAWHLRKSLGNAISAAQGDDRRILMLMRNHYDDWMEHRLTQGDLVNPTAGQPPGPPQPGGQVQAFGDLREGQRLWSRVRKSDTLAEMEHDARINANPSRGYTYSEALRQEYKKLARSDRIRTFTPDEQRAIEQVANGGPADTVYQLMAGFYPFSTAGALRSGVMGGGALAGGHGAAGALFPVAGIFGKAASNALVRKNAAVADMLIRGGAGTPMPRGPLMGGLPLSMYYGNMATRGPQ